jgi:hypothetical protein
MTFLLDGPILFSARPPRLKTQHAHALPRSF